MIQTASSVLGRKCSTHNLYFYSVTNCRIHYEEIILFKLTEFVHVWFLMLRSWAIRQGKHSVHNIWYGPRTRLSLVHICEIYKHKHKDVHPREISTSKSGTRTRRSVRGGLRRRSFSSTDISAVCETAAIFLPTECDRARGGLEQCNFDCLNSCACACFTPVDTSEIRRTSTSTRKRLFHLRSH